MVRGVQSHSKYPRTGILGIVLSLLLTSACSFAANTAEQTPTFSGPPTVRLSSPLPNDTYREGASVNILIRVENAGPDVARVAVRVNDEIVGEAIQPNEAGAAAFTIINSWTAPMPGQYTVSASATRSDGTSSEPATAVINVMPRDAAPQATIESSEDESASQPTQAPSNTPRPTQAQDSGSNQADSQSLTRPSNTPRPTEPQQPTPVPPTNTPSRPQVRVVTGANIRSGPAIAFDPPIGSYAAGTTSDILAVNPDQTWYKIRYFNSEGWIAGSVVEVVGNLSNIPVEAGPPTPIPVTATPTSPPAVSDLSIVDWSTSPFPPVCAQNTTTTVTIANSGTGSSGATTVILEDLFNGSATVSGTANLRELAPGENATVTINLTVSTNHSVAHELRVRVDPDNAVPETNENNNQRTTGGYPLQQGNCP